MNQNPQVVLYTPLSTNATIVIVASFLIVGFIVWLICQHKRKMKQLDKEVMYVKHTVGPSPTSSANIELDATKY